MLYFLKHRTRTVNPGTRVAAWRPICPVNGYARQTTPAPLSNEVF